MDTILPNSVNFIAANTYDMHIGIEGGYSWNPRDGKLDDIAIYNRAISAQEVSQLFGQFYDIQIDTTFVAVETCGSYTWNGVSYTESGDYTQTFTSSNGCDSVVTLHLTIIPTPELTHTPDAVIPAGSSIDLWASGADMLAWTDGNGNILASGPSLTVTPETCTSYYIIGQNRAAATNNTVVVNGDFEQGNVGFASDYTYSTNLWPEGMYCVGTNSQNFHSGFSYMPDHTTGTGNYMVVNGAESPNTIVWAQTVPVTPHTDYAFSTWVCTLGGDPSVSRELAQLQFSVNGSQLGDIFSAPSSFGVWGHYYEVWNSGDNTTALLTILNQNTYFGGNDFGIDDIVFAPLTDCSATDSVRVNIFYQTSDERTVCTDELPYEWNGVSFTGASSQTVTIPATNGCDSIVTMILTLSEPPEVTIDATADTICPGDNVTLSTHVEVSPPIPVPPVAIGDILCTDNSIVKPSDWPVPDKTAYGIVFYVDGSGQHGWAVHLRDQGNSIKWTPSGYHTDIPTLHNYTNSRDAILDLDGYTNTQLIRAAGNATTYPAAYAVDFDNGWYLPAIGQLNLIFASFVTLNASLQVVDGTQFSLNSYYTYWSSTEYGSSYAWRLTTYGSIGGYNSKNESHRVRSVRDF